VILKELSEARGVAGNEKAVRDLILGAAKEHTDEQRVDALGNLLCLRKARKPALPGARPRKVMLAAHMDEVGLIVTGINGDGTLRCEAIGGVAGPQMVSRQVLVGDGAVPGVIGYRPIHLIPSAERERPLDTSHLAIDVGATSKGGAEKLVKAGDYVTFRTAFALLDEEGLRTAKGKALDDRVGCAVLLELLREDYAFDLQAAFTAQEEAGLRGAQVAAYRLRPDVVLALEGTVCDDLPKKRDVTPVTELGKGPAITFMDRSLIADQRLVRLLVSVAQREGIPYQFKRAAVGGTDAGPLQRTAEGIPAVVVAVPTRYIHTPVSIVSLADFDNTVRLLREALHTLEGGLES
jgi:tetrahedral aminopeptidase